MGRVIWDVIVPQLGQANVLPWTQAKGGSWFLGGSRLNGCSGGSWHCPTEGMDMKTIWKPDPGGFGSDAGVFVQFSATAW